MVNAVSAVHDVLAVIVELLSVIEIASLIVNDPCGPPVKVKPDQDWLLPAGILKSTVELVAFTVIEELLNMLKLLDAERLNEVTVLTVQLTVPPQTMVAAVTEGVAVPEAQY